MAKLKSSSDGTKISRTYKFPQSTVDLIKVLAEQNNCTDTQIIVNAVNLFAEYQATNGAAFLGAEIQKSIEASQRLFENRVLNRLAPLLSEMAIQEGILATVIAQELEVNPDELTFIRREVYQAIESGGNLLNLKKLLDNR